MNTFSKEIVSAGRSTVLVSSLSWLRGPSLRQRVRKASLSGTTIGQLDLVAGSSSKRSKKQQPPPQQTFSISLVSAPRIGNRMRRTSPGLCDMSTVEARLLRGVVGGTTKVPSVFC